MNDYTVQHATGKTPKNWFRMIAQFDENQEKPHREIADFLYKEYKISYWWAQQITNLYEKDIGKRQVGQTENGLYQIGVSKTFHFSSEQVWNELFAAEGLKVLLGSPVETTNPEQLEGVSETGISFKMTTYKHLSHFRMKWKPKDWEEASVLQLRVMPKGDNKSLLTFHQEKLQNQDLREVMRNHWLDCCKQLLNNLKESD